MTAAKKREPRASRVASGEMARESWATELAELSYNQARTALELALGQLQSEDLEVEAMADLYRLALGYARRCEQVLEQVEQEIIQLDTSNLEEER
ncbi:exodeoxyribonuclease VII small subunit [Synechococcus sp. CS-1325]|nr:exodeoxyribonuclease VII small subunit [Synechococcus sp. CS-1325]MCT0214241.1 exodeoxyribonuclease VII small subunit [Synechococcus sp. CS-1326]MCT0232571.1 exodeoxyribonuclease VII small subunit [Synechococcus sp. CS-1327]PZV01064.1 MAG: exodeoxyribonuclease VII small subunit [Cyanobium sp.]